MQGEYFLNFLFPKFWGHKICLLEPTGESEVHHAVGARVRMIKTYLNLQWMHWIVLVSPFWKYCIPTYSKWNLSFFFHIKKPFQVLPTFNLAKIILSPQVEHSAFCLCAQVPHFVSLLTFCFSRSSKKSFQSRAATDLMDLYSSGECQKSVICEVGQNRGVSPTLAWKHHCPHRDTPRNGERAIRGGLGEP